MRVVRMIAVIIACCQLMATTAWAGAWFFIFHFPILIQPDGKTVPAADVQVGPWPSQRICRDVLGTAGCEHGPLCLDHPSVVNCACMGPGVAQLAGATVSNDCFKQGQAKGFYFFALDPTLGQPILMGPFSKRKCIKQSDECFPIGAISNTEGSLGGP